jgi:hypothetical protein
MNNYRKLKNKTQCRYMYVQYSIGQNESKNKYFPQKSVELEICIESRSMDRTPRWDCLRKWVKGPTRRRSCRCSTTSRRPTLSSLPRSLSSSQLDTQYLSDVKGYPKTPISILFYHIWLIPFYYFKIIHSTYIFLLFFDLFPPFFLSCTSILAITN